MIQKIISIPLLFFMIVLVSGCMTMAGFQNDMKEIHFDADVPNVEINIGEYRFWTPGAFVVDASDYLEFTAKKEGYVTQHFLIAPKISKAKSITSKLTNFIMFGWWTWGAGALVGSSIDTYSGSVRELKDDAYFIHMEPL